MGRNYIDQTVGIVYFTVQKRLSINEASVNVEWERNDGSKEFFVSDTVDNLWCD